MCENLGQRHQPIGLPGIDMLIEETVQQVLSSGKANHEGGGGGFPPRRPLSMKALQDKSSFQHVDRILSKHDLANYQVNLMGREGGVVDG